MEKIELDVEGMHCGSCAIGIQMLVSQMDGVTSASADYDKKKAWVEFDSGKTNKDAIIKAIEELGYKAH